MEVTKLYNITDEIVRSEGTAKFDQLFKKIVSSLNTLKSNPNNPTVLKQFEDNREILLQNLRSSKLNRLTPSNIKITKEIGADKYFGSILAENIENILSINNFNISAVATEFNKLKTERDNYISNLKSLNEIFDSFNLDMHWWSDKHKFEIGLLIPSKITSENEIPKVAKHLNKWNQIIKDVNEITGKDSSDIKIAFQDIGSLEYFFQSPEITATAIITGVERLTALYKKILEIRKIRNDLKKYDFPKKDQNAAMKHESDVSEKEIKSITEDLFKEYGKKRFEGNRRNEMKNALSLHLRWIAKQIDEGEIIEVNTPEIKAPKQNEKSDDIYAQEIEQYEIDKARIDLLKSKANLFSEITGATKKVFKYLQSPDEEE